MATTSPRPDPRGSSLGDSIMERDRLCAQIWKLARAGHIPHIDPDEVPSMIGSPSSQLASEVDAARSASCLDDARFDEITAGCADEYRRFKDGARGGGAAAGGRRGRRRPGPGRGDGPGPEAAAEKPSSVAPEESEPLFERGLVVAGKRKRSASAKARSLASDGPAGEDGEGKDEGKEEAASGGGEAGGKAEKDGRPRTGRKTLKRRGPGKPAPSVGVRQWTSLDSIEGGEPERKKRRKKSPRGGGRRAPGASPRRTAAPSGRGKAPRGSGAARTSKLSGGTVVGPDGRARKCPLPHPESSDPSSLAEWTEVERTLSGYAWIERGRYGKYRSRISLDGRKVELGCYDLASDAALAYDLGAARFGLVEGRGAELNFPPDGGGGAEGRGGYEECRALEERAYGVEVDGDGVRETIDARVAGAG